MWQEDTMMDRFLSDEGARPGARDLLLDWQEDLETTRRAAVVSSPSFRDKVQDAAQRIEPVPTPHADVLAAGVFDARGEKLWSDPRFESWLQHSDPNPQKVAEALRSSNARAFVHHIDDQKVVSLVCAPVDRVLNWPLSEPVRQALNLKGAAGLVLAVSAVWSDRPIAETARAYALTPMEARLVAALLRSTNLREAARVSGLTYGSARQAVKEILRKTGAGRQTELVSLFSRAATGTISDVAGEVTCLMDMFGLGIRDARLALGLADGLTREAAAKSIGISSAVAKDAFDRLFQQMGVSTSVELGRRVVEAHAAHLLAAASGGEFALNGEGSQPLRFLRRSQGGYIAISDFGPEAGAPILLLHSSATTRHPSRKLVRKLQDSGLRPIAIDRPGFGLSDFFERTTCPFVDAAADMAETLDALNIRRAHVLARGGAHVALAFARHHPGRSDRVVLINPDTDIAKETKREGLLGAIKEIAFCHPDRLNALCRILGAQATPERVKGLVRAALRSSPIDLAAFADTAELEDYQRAVMMFAAGRLSGFVREQRAYAGSIDAPRLSRSSDWRVLLGAHDPIRHVADMQSYWEARLPEAQFCLLEDAGRFLHLTHPSNVIDAILD